VSALENEKGRREGGREGDGRKDCAYYRGRKEGGREGVTRGSLSHLLLFVCLLIKQMPSLPTLGSEEEGREGRRTTWMA
jgi:hypothetical protein